MVGIWLKKADASLIDKKVEDVFQETGMRYPENTLTEIVKRYMSMVGNGVDIRLHKFNEADNDISGAIRFADEDADEKTTIFLNEDKHPNRQLFTLAHEFGHFVLQHRSGGENNKFRIDFGSDYYPSDRDVRMEELQANHFAGAMLMPRDEVNELKSLGYSTEAMADHFSVSRSALHFRLAWLDWVDQN